MRMVVTNIAHKDGQIMVTGDTGIGILKGIWKGRGALSVAETYFFELSIEPIDRKEISIVHTRNVAPTIVVKELAGEDWTVFTGVCEEYDEIYVIRFCTDWIEMLEVDNDDFTIKKGHVLTFSQKVSRIGIYPYDMA